MIHGPSSSAALCRARPNEGQKLSAKLRKRTPIDIVGRISIRRPCGDVGGLGSGGGLPAQISAALLSSQLLALAAASVAVTACG